MRLITRTLFTLTLLGFGQFVFAAPYVWTVQGYGYHTGSSPMSAAQSAKSANGWVSIDWCIRSNDSSFTCRTNWQPGGYYFNFNVVRSGDSCSDPLATFNPATGECEAPPEPEPDKCAEKAGQDTPVRREGTRGDGYLSVSVINGKNYPVHPDDGCRGGCQVTVQQTCILTPSSDAYSCIGKGYYTGASCEAAPANQLEESPDTEQRAPTETDTKEPCVYVQDAEGRSHCVSKETQEKEGQNCGTYNGVSLCVPKEASLDEKKVETEVKETTDADGGKTTVKKDVATETKCKGSKDNCTTTTTTTTTTTKSDGSGTETKTETVCSGANCGSTGGGGGGGGSGSGDGEGEEEGGGDLPGNDDVASFGESLQSFNARIAAAPVLSAVSSISMPSGGSCSMPSASVPLIGTVSFNQICQNADILDPLYHLMLAIWALGAVRIFLEA
ncbi:hypothetical protein [Phytopseudomonas daroniae]|uniref:hypothetical protein n=1 Tax=Phytopseudomonas daroniae TaxID=2487519 RepID=UPI001038335B|nr:hypothetical protein [Pseudomonas daroniae]